MEKNSTEARGRLLESTPPDTKIPSSSSNLRKKTIFNFNMDALSFRTKKIKCSRPFSMIKRL